MSAAGKIVRELSLFFEKLIVLHLWGWRSCLGRIAAALTPPDIDERAHAATGPQELLYY
jgi:hypothetical protein